MYNTAQITPPWVPCENVIGNFKDCAGLSLGVKKGPGLWDLNDNAEVEIEFPVEIDSHNIKLIGQEWFMWPEQLAGGMMKPTVITRQRTDIVSRLFDLTL